MSDERVPDEALDVPRQVIMSTTRAMCGLHGEPFRAQWPLGYAVYVVKAWQTLTDDHDLVPEFWRAVDDLELGMENVPDDRRLADTVRVLDGKPLCCWLNDAKLLRPIMEASSVSVDGVCHRCKQGSPGTPFMLNGNSIPHICWSCQFDKLMPGRG